MKLKIFFCQFPNPWTLRVSGMGGYTSKCEKKSKSLHPTAHPVGCKIASCRILYCKWMFGALGLFSIWTCHFPLEAFFPLIGDCFCKLQLAGGYLIPFCSLHKGRWYPYELLQKVISYPLGPLAGGIRSLHAAERNQIKIQKWWRH